MTEWKARKFWTDVAVCDAEAGFSVLLDDRPLRTPAKVPLVVPTRDLANMIAEEWRAQVDTIDPGTMPATRTANAAIDKVSVQMPEVAAHITEYGESDLLCYRADKPEALVSRQSRGWDPVLAWADAAMDVKLNLAVGVMPVAQPPASILRLQEAVLAHDPFALSALYELVSLSGSLVLGLAVSMEELSAAQAWTLSVLDEEFQIEQWGEDEEAAAASALKRDGFLLAARFLKAAKG